MLDFFTMYIYFDESFVVSNGIKYVFLGCIAYRTECTENTIYKFFSKSKLKLKHREEIKFSNVRNPNIKDNILRSIKKGSLFHHSAYTITQEQDNIHHIINSLIENCLQEFSQNHNVQNLKIIYDRSTYLIDEESLKNKFSFIQNIKMRDSKIFAGLQNADWIVGEAASEFKNKKTVN